MKNLVDEIKGLTSATSDKKFVAKDYSSDQDVRWCPGCGDYSILAQVQRVLPETGIPPHNIAFVSGIGCSSRFPYYMSTYGFHGIHGRAPAIASGLKLARPDIDVWVATGDGDGLSIGGNHLIHTLRRNISLKILLFNNQIYGLTKGQYSPTSETGKQTKSSPMGTIESPFNPIAVAIGSQATFVARSMDRDPKHMQMIIKRAAEHKGVAFVEIYQNCVVFNDGAFFQFTEKDVKDEHVLYLEHGKPMIFGKAKDKGIKIEGSIPRIVSFSADNMTISDLSVYDETDPSLAFMLSEQTYNQDFPRPVGVFFKKEIPTYEQLMLNQIRTARAQNGSMTMDQLLSSGETWQIT